MGGHLSAFTDTQFTLIGFVIFFLLFIVFIAVTGLPSERAKFKYLEQLPLDDQDGKGAV